MTVEMCTTFRNFSKNSIYSVLKAGKLSIYIVWLSFKIVDKLVD